MWLPVTPYAHVISNRPAEVVTGDIGWRGRGLTSRRRIGQSDDEVMQPVSLNTKSKNKSYCGKMNFESMKSQ